MRDVLIAGIGQVPVGEHWETSLRHLAAKALLGAMEDAGVDRLDGLYVGNMLSGPLSQQEHLGALLADFVGQRGIEALKVEATIYFDRCHFRRAGRVVKEFEDRYVLRGDAHWSKAGHALVADAIWPYIENSLGIAEEN